MGNMALTEAGSLQDISGTVLSASLRRAVWKYVDSEQTDDWDKFYDETQVCTNNE